MLTPKRKRQPTRTPQEKLEDQFMDLTTAQQAKALDTFQTLHRMKLRFDMQGQRIVDPQGSLLGDQAEGAKL